MHALTCLLLLVGALLGAAAPAAAQPGVPDSLVALVEVQTSAGSFRIEMQPDTAPLTVANFLRLVDAGSYDGTIFHRVMPNLVQGGGYTDALERLARGSEVRNEAAATLSNQRGTVAMVHQPGRPHSATTEFFVNVADNTYLDHANESPSGYGWAVFGIVTEGMDVVDAIAATPTGPRGKFVRYVPLDLIVIDSIRRVEP